MSVILRNRILIFFVFCFIQSSQSYATSPVFYSVCKYGTADLKVASNITITNGVATLTAAQTGNIGAGCEIEYNSLRAYIAPNRIGFDSGGTTELEMGAKIKDATSGATGIVRYVEVTSGTWGDGNAAGWIYFEKTTGTFGNNNQINQTKPTSVSNIATVDGTIQGNIGNGNTEFVVKTATGGTPSNQTSTSVTSIHHEYASLADLEAGFTDANHVNNTNLTSANVIVFACCYYDHADYTADSGVQFDFGTTGEDNFVYIYTPTGGAESINNQRHGGSWDGNKYAIADTTFHCLRLTESYLHVDGLQATTNNTSTYNGIILDAYRSYITIKNCIVKNAYYGIQCPSLYSGAAKIYNCVLYGHNYVGIDLYGKSGAISRAINCTVYDSGGDADYHFGIRSSTDYCEAHNCIVVESGHEDFDSDLDSQSNNISSDATASGTGSQTNKTLSDLDFVSTVSESEDLHIESTSCAVDAGTDLSSSYGIWRDIDGNERDATWDIGADEFVSLGPSNIKSINAILGTSIKSVNAVLFGAIKSVNTIE